MSLAGLPCRRNSGNHYFPSLEAFSNFSRRRVVGTFFVGLQVAGVLWFCVSCQQLGSLSGDVQRQDLAPSFLRSSLFEISAGILPGRKSDATGTVALFGSSPNGKLQDPCRPWVTTTYLAEWCRWIHLVTQTSTLMWIGVFLQWMNNISMYI